MLHVAPIGFLSFSTGGYVILQSAYPDGTSAYMTRAGVSGSSTKGTVWRWAKGYGSQSQQCIFFTRNFPTGYSQFQHSTYNGLGTWSYQHTSSFTTVEMNTTARPIDPTAWRLEMLAWDTTQGTAANRMRLYYNFDEVPWTHNNSGGAPTYPSSSLAIPFANSSYSNYLGTFYWGSPSNYLQDSAAMWGYCDGTQLTPSDVAEQDARGNTIPLDLITPGTFDVGSAGFLMDFADTGNYGKDVAPIVGSHTTARDCTVTGTWTQTNDSPTDSKTDGVGNYATLNPAYPDTGSTTFSEGYTKAVNTSATTGTFGLTVGLPTSDTQIYYGEFILGNNGNDTNYLGVADANSTVWGTSTQLGTASGHVGLRTTGGAMRIHYDGSSNAATTTPDAANDRFVVAVKGTKVWLGLYDNSAGNTKWVDQSGTERTTDEPALGTNASYDFSTSEMVLVGISIRNNTSNGDMQLQADSVDWVGTPPSGAVSINTANLPAPTVTDPSAYMQTVLYEGNGTAIGSGGNAISSVGFQSDFVWIKNRDATDEHMIYDAVRGATKDLNSDSASAEATDTEGLSTFDSDGFTVGSNVAVNTNAESYVAWCLKAGGSGSSNNDGSITSTVSVADHGGFSIATYTGNATSGATVGHGLSAAPSMVIVKGRSQAYDWRVYHEVLTSGNTLYLSATNDQSADGNRVSAASATTFTLTGTGDQINGSGETYVAYAFARTPGLIGIGSYTGNGSADGPYVVVDDGGSGFRPAFLLIKNINNGSAQWEIWDAARDPYNLVTGSLWADAATAESTVSGNDADFLANGFKVRTSNANANGSGNTHIYLAFAEYPFGGEGISQARAR